MEHPPIDRIKELTANLNQWRHEYYNLNAPTVSDAVYDHFLDELAQLEQEADFILSNSPTQTVGYEVVDGLDKTTHTIPLLSLDKTKDIGDIMRFIGNHQVMLMQKIDGLTVKLEYENGALVRASTRGNGEEGEVVTHNARAIEGIPARIRYKERLVVAGEVYITKPTFDRLKETLRDSTGNPYKNARNMAAGSIRCHDAGACAGRGLVFSPFGVIEGFDEDTRKSYKLAALKWLGFSTCRYVIPDTRAPMQTISDIISNLRNIADAEGVPIDGIVVTYNDIAFSQSCGRTGHHYKDGLAFKFEDNLHETILRDIEWTPSRFGELSPVAIFDSVMIDGCEITRASLHNLTFITDLELMPGCRILISKRNMIIPHVEENLDRGGFNAKELFPAYCSSCSTPTRIKQTEKDKNRVVRVLRCDNPSCANQLLRKFVHFVGKKAMDIEGLSEATLEKFINNGWLVDLTDIYRLDRYAKEIQQMDGFGMKSWQRLWDAIQRSRTTTFERFVVAMDIPMIGRTASKELGNCFNRNLDDVEGAVECDFDFTILDGFGETLQHNIKNWFALKDNQKLWKELQEMVTVQDAKTANKSPSRTNNPFVGCTIVVTGKLVHFTRDSINARIETLGAKAGSAVSKTTDYLVVGEKAGSKLDKAKTLGVPVLSEQEFLNMVACA